MEHPVGTDHDLGDGWTLTTWDAFPPCLLGPNGEFAELRPGSALVCGTGHPRSCLAALVFADEAFRLRWPAGSARP